MPAESPVAQTEEVPEIRRQDMPVKGEQLNGFGRTGRATFRAAHEQDAAIEWAGINDMMASMLAHLLRDDSVYGPFPAPSRY